MSEIAYKRILLKISGEALAGGKGSALGTGGMATKIEAAKICMACGCDMIITNGAVPTSLSDVVEARDVGTKFSRK